MKTASVTRLPIPQHVLLACEPFGPRLSAEKVLAAIASGLEGLGLKAPDLCPLPASEEHGEDIRVLLDDIDFDARMRSARAVILGAKTLEESTLAGSMAFEIATRARQAGVPAYAITADNALDSFDARILDLQEIVQARGASQLTAAGKRLAAVV